MNLQDGVQVQASGGRSGRPGLVVGLDGGASSTKAVLVAQDGEVLAAATGPACAHGFTGEGRARLREAIAVTLTRLLEQAARATTAFGPAPVRAATFGITGLGPGTEPAAFAAAVGREILQGAEVEVVDDVGTAFAAGTGNGPGVVVYGGTGSVAMARGPEGQLARAGGQGYVIDDLGGGFDIGRRALRAMVRAWDGRGSPTRLEQLLCARLGIEPEWKALRERIYGVDVPTMRVMVASLVPTVGEAAREGDPVASGILQEAARELALLGRAVALRSGLESAPEGAFEGHPEPTPESGSGGREYRLVAAGGIFRLGEVLLVPFGEEVRRALPHAVLYPPLLEPVGGAALLAMARAGWQAGPAEIERIRERLAPRP